MSLTWHLWVLMLFKVPPDTLYTVCFSLTRASSRGTPTSLIKGNMTVKRLGTKTMTSKGDKERGRRQVL